jgi:hypothetical protein
MQKQMQIHIHIQERDTKQNPNDPAKYAKTNDGLNP